MPQTAKQPFMLTSRLSAVTDKGDVEPLSDVDERVLQSLLEDENLDLKSEENLKKMLESGVKKKDKSAGNKVDEGNSEFSSTFFKTLNDNELWNSIKAKADSMVESAKIYVQNKVERDAQLLASIGVFAWERAIKDSKRALPSKGKSGAGMAKTMRDSLFMLTNNSSFVQYIPEDNFILPPSKYSQGVETSVFEELNTPMDEIKSVTQSIRDILKGKTVSQDRGLRSVASAGSSKNDERQKMAYERKKETVLKREKEGVNTKVMRATGSLTDGIAELKREMEVEGNDAGYRAKNAQQQLKGTLENAGLLGSGADKTFRGIGERLFGSQSASSSSPLRIERSTDIFDDEIDVFPELTKDDIINERKRVVEGLNACLTRPGETWLKPGTTIVVQEERVEENGENPYFVETLNSDISNESWENVITTMVLTRNDIEAQMSDDSEVYRNEEEIFTELQNLKTRVQMISSLAAVSSGYEASEALKAEVIGALDKDDQGTLLSSLDDIIIYRKEQKLASEARKQEADARRIAEEARINEFKLQNVADEGKKRLFEIFTSTKVEKQDTNAVVENSVQGEVLYDVFEEREKDPAISPDEISDFADTFAVVVSEVVPSESIDSDATRNRVDASEPILADVEFEISSKNVRNLNDNLYEYDDAMYATVEIVNDEDADQGSFKEVDMDLNSAAFDDLPNTKTSERSMITKIALRSIDVVLFVVEKTFTVGVPGTITTYQLARERTDEMNRQGMGKEGWSSLENINDASNRY